MYTDDDKNPGAIPDMLLPTYMAKSLRAMMAPRAVQRITFNRNEAAPGETLFVSVPKLNEHEVLVPGTLALRFDIDLEGGYVNNFLVQNVMRALVDKLVVKFAGTTLQDTEGYDITKRSKTCSFLSNGARTWCWRGSRTKSYARYAPKPGTRKRRASTLKTS